MERNDLSRRRFLSISCLVALSTSLTLPTRAQDAAPEPPIPTTGLEVPSMSSCDRAMLGLLLKWKIPGGSLAVMNRGRLVFARGYGWADAEKTKPVQPYSLFRIASISKQFTATAILQLVERGKLGLDDKVWPIVGVEPLPSQKMDARLKDITIRQLLLHSGGWDRVEEKDSEISRADHRIAKDLGRTLPLSTDDFVQFIAGQPLQFDPGTRHAYSNLGYLLLGRVVEKVSGVGYEEFVRREILTPAGIKRIKIGSELPKDRDVDEVSYFDKPGTPLVPSIFEPGKMVTRPDGGFSVKAKAAVGGWIATPSDLLRLVRALDPKTPPQVLAGANHLLSDASVAQMTARPDIPQWKDTPAFYGLGWFIRPKGTDANWWHGGEIPGTEAHLVRFASGVVWAATFNMRPYSTFHREMESSITESLSQVTNWPRHDFFPGFP